MKKYGIKTCNNGFKMKQNEPKINKSPFKSI